ncbi:MAG: hypothetical protein J6W21_00160 [Bacteroidaceae bacterium]|nr:hypothetical protein [Bacteroidaceae bacterium]
MNVKIRMPKMYQHFVRNSMMKELFMTFIGATLSIVLTFGTAHYIDLREKKALGRQTAIMVIHDMDNTVELLKELGKDEKENVELTRYVMDHYDTMESITKVMSRQSLVRRRRLRNTSRKLRRGSNNIRRI